MPVTRDSDPAAVAVSGSAGPPHRASGPGAPTVAGTRTRDLASEPAGSGWSGVGAQDFHGWREDDLKAGPIEFGLLVAAAAPTHGGPNPTRGCPRMCISRRVDGRS